MMPWGRFKVGPGRVFRAEDSRQQLPGAFVPSGIVIIWILEHVTNHALQPSRAEGFNAVWRGTRIGVPEGVLRRRS